MSRPKTPAKLDRLIFVILARGIADRSYYLDVLRCAAWEYQERLWVTWCSKRDSRRHDLHDYRNWTIHGIPRKHLLWDSRVIQ